MGTLLTGILCRLICGDRSALSYQESTYRRSTSFLTEYEGVGKERGTGGSAPLPVYYPDPVELHVPERCDRPLIGLRACTSHCSGSLRVYADVDGNDSNMYFEATA